MGLSEDAFRSLVSGGLRVVDALGTASPGASRSRPVPPITKVSRSE